MKPLNNDWDEFLNHETKKDYYLNLREFLKTEYSCKRIFPPMNDIFNALKFTPLSKTNVVILGQDPYINPNEAHGLAFSVQPSAKIPPSLKNIFKELQEDVGCYIPNNGCLVKWAKQGVMLLNAVLTVRAGQSKSHSKMGWELFTTAIIKKLNEKETPVVFMLWGKDAQEKASLITDPKHLVLTAAHPSPLAGGRFFGSRHFSKANVFLKRYNLPEIDWQIENI